MYTHEQIRKNLEARRAIFEYGEDGGAGDLTIRGIDYRFQYSFGGGWEHVSISVTAFHPRLNKRMGRTATWDEMCMMKDIFWPGTEACVQYHPPKSDYINVHKYCLHIWRPIEEELLMPPSNMVG